MLHTLLLGRSRCTLWSTQHHRARRATLSTAAALPDPCAWCPATASQRAEQQQQQQASSPHALMAHANAAAEAQQQQGAAPSPWRRHALQQHHNPQQHARAQQHGLRRALRSVFKVYTTSASPSYASPWQMHGQTKSTATAFAIAPLASRRILTNAHAVAHQVQVQLRKHGSAKKFTAKVLAVGHECDMAMLTVEDDEFWSNGVEALELGGVPAQQESVSVLGYPTGGDNCCVTKGVVSRVDRQMIDAAINSGNSGGPVVVQDEHTGAARFVGLAFQCLTAGESIGYVIPQPVVTHFLEDLARHGGRYTGFCELGVCWQPLESPDLKAALGMLTSPTTPAHAADPSSSSASPPLTGVYVTAVEPCYPAAQVLKPGDVLLSFDGHPIADDGTFLFHPSPGGPSSSPPSPLALPAPASSASALLLTPGHTVATAPGCATPASTPLLPAPASSEPAPAAAPTQPLTFTFPGTLSPSPKAPLKAPPASPTTPTTHQQRDAADRQAPTLCAASPAAAAAALDDRGAGAEQQQPSPCTTSALGQQAGGAAATAALPPLSPGGAVLGGGGAHPHPHAARIDFRHLVSMHFAGDACKVGVWRDGRVLPGGVRVQLTPPKQLVPVHSHDEKPSYLIWGGLVFTRLTTFYLRSTYGQEWTHKAPVKLCDVAFAGVLEAEGQECVILSKVLAWDVNAGYQDLGNLQVFKVAGVPVHNLAHLADVLARHPGPYVRLDLQWHKVVVLNVAKCRDALADILEQNCIAGPGCFPQELAVQASVTRAPLPQHIAEATERALAEAREALAAKSAL